MSANDMPLECPGRQEAVIIHLEKLALEHSSHLKALKEESDAEIARLSGELEKSRSETVSSTAAVRKEMEALFRKEFAARQNGKVNGVNGTTNGVH